MIEISLITEWEFLTGFFACFAFFRLLLFLLLGGFSILVQREFGERRKILERFFRKPHSLISSPGVFLGALESNLLALLFVFACRKKASFTISEIANALGQKAKNYSSKVRKGLEQVEKSLGIKITERGYGRWKQFQCDFGSEITALMGAVGEYQYLDFNLYLLLKSAVAKRLYEILESRRNLCGESHFLMGLDKLCGVLGLGYVFQSQKLRAIKNASQQLIDLGYLSRVEFDGKNLLLFYASDIVCIQTEETPEIGNQVVAVSPSDSTEKPMQKSRAIEQLAKKLQDRTSEVENLKEEIAQLKQQIADMAKIQAEQKAPVHEKSPTRPQEPQRVSPEILELGQAFVEQISHVEPKKYELTYAEKEQSYFAGKKIYSYDEMCDLLTNRFGTELDLESILRFGKANGDKDKLAQYFSTHFTEIYQRYKQQGNPISLLLAASMLRKFQVSNEFLNDEKSKAEQSGQPTIVNREYFETMEKITKQREEHERNAMNAQNFLEKVKQRKDEIDVAAIDQKAKSLCTCDLDSLLGKVQYRSYFCNKVKELFGHNGDIILDVQQSRELLDLVNNR